MTVPSPLRRGLAAAALCLALAVAGCGGGGEATPEYRAVGTVLEVTRTPSAEVGAHGPQLCLGPIMMSLPPQCGGIDIVGWDWDTVTGERSAAGTTWGSYAVVGTFDGSRFALSEPARPATDRAGDPRHPDFTTPCPEPPGGWIPRAGRADDDLLARGATRYLDRSPDTSAVWLDMTRARVVVNVRVTRSVAAHRARLRSLIPGNLCVIEGGRSRAALNRMLNVEIRRLPRANRLGGLVDEVAGTSELWVVLDRDGELERDLDARYGPGAIRVSSALAPAS